MPDEVTASGTPNRILHKLSMSLFFFILLKLRVDTGYPTCHRDPTGSLWLPEGRVQAGGRTTSRAGPAAAARGRGKHERVVVTEERSECQGHAGNTSESKIQHQESKQRE